MDIAVTSDPQPAGTYLVGDPCYAFAHHDVWMALLESADYTDTSQRILDAHADGRRFIAATTAHGDGAYRDQHNRVYTADAGLLGVVPEASADPDSATLFALHRHTFTSEFTVSYRDGIITIGDITITTA